MQGRLERDRVLGEAERVDVEAERDRRITQFVDSVHWVEASGQHFADRRVNKVNLRREYFYAKPAEVLEVLQHHAGTVIEFTEEPEAEEYRIRVSGA